MFQALNMELEIVRTVLVNDVNELYVCIDQKMDTSVFYTLISVKSTEVRRELVKRISLDGLFSSNSDFVGHFNHMDSLNLVFLYKRENKFSTNEVAFAESFKSRKDLATAFLTACAETEITGCVGELLIDDRNINISKDAKVYFNYFMDFSKLQTSSPPIRFFQSVAGYTFGILTREYNLKYDGMIDDYPDELQVFHKKIQTKGFTTFNHLITYIKMLPDKLHEKSTGVRRLWDRFLNLKQYLKQNYVNVFLVAIVVSTVIFTAIQITTRVSAGNMQKKSTSYIGLDTIGEVYLGNVD